MQIPKPSPNYSALNAKAIQAQTETILKILRTGRGMPLNQIAIALSSEHKINPGIPAIQNRLLLLRRRGLVQAHRPEDGPTRYYAVPAWKVLFRAIARKLSR